MKKTKINFEKGEGLVPTIIQDATTNTIYMLGYMNKEALEKTQETGFVYLWSRSRKRLWKKGEESKNTLSVKEILIDCDSDSLLIKVMLNGKTCCHTGRISCFFTKIKR